VPRDADNDLFDSRSVLGQGGGTIPVEAVLLRSGLVVDLLEHVLSDPAVADVTLAASGQADTQAEGASETATALSDTAGALARVLTPLCAEPADATHLMQQCRALVPVLAAVRDPAEDEAPQDLTLTGVAGADD
jgi:hypothetical protein